MSEDRLPGGLGEPVLQARMRVQHDDFRVIEDLGFEASGSGEHLLLRVEKRGANTAWVAEQLARWAGIAPMGVSYAGLKDRHAVTEQTFSVHLAKRVAPDALPVHESFRVLDQAWHSRKLPRGALAGNHFVLRLRDLQGERAAVEDRLTHIAARGVPNYFGEQRFGRDGGNVAAAIAMFAGRRVDRAKRGFLISAARSSLFNRVLAERVAAGTWDQALNGEVFMLDGSHSVFGPEPLDQSLRQRLAELDIHPTGPMWGRGELRPQADALALETRVLSDQDALKQGLESEGLRQERRALRLPVRQLRWQWLDDAPHRLLPDLELRFFLPAGAYATVVLHALGEVSDASLTSDMASAPLRR